MELHKQVCSLELAKRLKELGVKQESFFHYLDEREYEGEEDENGNPCDYKIEIIQNADTLPGKEISLLYSAFTVAELGNILPNWFDSAKWNYDIWVCRFMELKNDKKHHCFGVSDADVRAKMLIYLLENNLMELPNEG
jgi:hypothetical protein